MSVIEADVTEKEVYVFPTSLAQQRLWFLNQLEPDSPAYNITFAVRISGDLKVCALERSLQALVNRHEILRTTFMAVDGRPVQVVASHSELTLPIIDLRGWPEDEREERARQLVRDEAQHIFDLAAGPLFRTSLFQLAEREYVLLLSMHHIVSDGWSMNVFVSETAALYDSFRRDQPSPLSDLPLQYADYAIWQREWLEGVAAESQLSYWRQQLSSDPTVLDLPFDRPRTTAQSNAGRKQSIVLEPELTDQLKTLSRQEGVTIFMTLLAAFQALLYRYTNQEDINVGSSVAGRDRKEIEGLIGCFLNTLVLRTDLSGNPTFRELLGRVREVALAAYANQDVPVERLLEELQPERHLSHDPLFQVMFILQNAPLGKLQLADVTLTLLPNDSSTAKFDLTLDLTEGPEGLVGFVEYRSDLFEPETIARFIAHLRMMLAAIVECPDTRVVRLPLLRPAEQQQLLVEFAQSENTVAGSSSSCLHELFEQQAKRTPSAVAIVGAGEELTYEELAIRSWALARYLRAKGLRGEQLVGVCLERTPRLLVALLGILQAGGAYIPLDPRYPRERLKWVLEDARAAWLLTEESLLDAMQAIESECSVISLDGAWEEISRTAEAFDDSGREQASPANLAYVIYTSGSTGNPKGVAVQHHSIVSYVETARELFSITPRDRVLQFASISFDTSAEEIYPALASGATLVLRTDEMLSSAGAFLQKCAEWGITVLDLPTAYWHSLATALNTHSLNVPESLRLVILGGEKALRERVSQWQRRAGEQVRLINTYGPTESTIVGTSYEVSDLPAASLEVPIGRAVRNAETYVLDSFLQPAPIGVAGELHIGGSGLARGYLNAPELTAQKFIPHPFGEAGARLYKTGDRARYRSDGQLEFLGRLDHQVKLRGFRIEPGEIEAALCEHNAVGEAIVLLREDAADEKRLVAYVQASEESGLTVVQLRTLLQQRLPDYMVPSAFVLLDKLPRTPSGKVDRAALPKPDQYKSEGFVAPRNPTEELVAEIWRQVLNLPQVGAEDNFFNLGGHSLLATQVTARLRDELQVELPLRAFFETPTVVGIAAQIDVKRRGGQSIEFPAIEPVPRDQLLPLSFSQERLWFISQLDPDNTAYHVPRAIRIIGDLNVALVQATFTEIVRRHEILRTSFPTVDGRPVQLIHAPHPIDLSLIDLRSLPRAEREAEVQHFIRTEGNQPFDFTQEPLIRVSLLQLEGQEHVLVLTEHHLVHDGWTQGVLMRDFVAVYSAFRIGQPSPLPDLVIQYADFAHWQRRWLQGSVLEDQLEYWKKQLYGAPPLLELPSVRPRPPVQSFRGAEFNLELDATTAGALREFSRNHGVTLFMTMLAAFDVLLLRYSGATDVVVGSGIANRRWQALENLLGMIINTVVLRVDLSGNPTFIELLQRVRETTLDVYSHQDLPFEKLVEEIQPQRTLSYTPLFQVMFSFLDTPMLAMQLPGLEIQAIGAHNQTAKFDLNVVVVTPAEQSAGLRGINNGEDQRSEITVAFEYSTDVFDEQAIEQLADHYRRLLQAVLKNPDQRLLQLPLLSDAERELPLKTWNQTRREYPRNQTVSRLFEQQVKRTPEAIAVVFSGTKLTYAELNSRANRLAQHLRTRGVGPDVTVGLFVERSIEMIVALLGILKAGGAYVPLDPQNPRERISFMLRDADVALLLTRKRSHERLPGSDLPVIDLDSDEADFAAYAENNFEVDNQPDNLAYVMYTSGSTGLPKGVAVTQRNIVRLVTNTDYAEFGSDEVFLQLAPLSFDASTFEIWGSLLNGARLVIMPPELPLLEDIAGKLREYSVTTLWLTSGLFTQMADEHAVDLAGVRQLLAGGDVLSPTQVRKVLAERSGDDCVINGYGPTESTTFACCYRVKTASQIENSVPIGKPIANTTVYILDANLEPVPTGVTGELYIGGDGLARGYFQRPDLTAERFLPDRFSGEPGARLYRTGDLTRYLRDGNIEFVGRADQQVKVRGFRVELDEIETVLDENPGISKSVVTVREDDRGGKRLVAYLVQLDRAGLTTSDLRQYLQQSLPDYMVPSAFVTLDALPLTRNGKIDRAALTARADGESVAGLEYVAPRTPVEEILAEIWSEVLGIQKISANDNFFELGGHSLLATQVISRVRKMFAVEVGLRRLFEEPTVGALSRSIEVALRAGEGVTVPVLQRLGAAEGEQSGTLPLSFAQQRLWFLDQLEPGSGVYNVPLAVRLKGELEIAALERALSEIVRRHEVLRTRFVSVGGEPRQEVLTAVDVKLAVTDLSELNEEEREAAVREAASAESLEPFDLVRGPLLRVKLLRLSDEEHVVLLTMHHIVSDGWSMGVLIKEVTTLYEVYSQGGESPLTELPIQYKDFAIWQRKWLQGEELERQLGYWREQLVGELPALDLPTDRARPAVSSYRGAQLGFRLSPEVSAGLKELSRREGVTLFMTLLAAFQTLLHRYSGQEDIVVGLPVAGRNYAETEGLIGFFVNTLALRVKLGSDPTFVELLRRVKEVCLGAYAHQDVPFEKLVEELQPERDLSRSPLFQTMFVLQNVPQQQLQLSGLKLSEVGGENATAKFDLSLTLVEKGEELQGSLEYSTDLFEGARIERMLRHFDVLLQGIVAQPEQRLWELPLLRAEEWERIRYWSETRSDHRPVTLVHELFEAQVERTPEAVALVSGGEQLSYGELNRRANQLAHYLQRQGVGAEVVVGLCTERSLGMVVGLLGILKAGGAYLPLDPSYPKERLSWILEDANADWVLTEESLLEAMQSIESDCPVLNLDSARDEIFQASDDERVSVNPANLAYVIYTSGSTGRPKGVAIQHGSIVNYVETARELFRITAGDRILQFASTSFDTSAEEIYTTLASGATLVLRTDEMLSSAAAFLRQCDEWGITVLDLPTSYWHGLALAMSSQSRNLPESLRLVILGGEKALRERFSQWQRRAGDQVRVTNTYGPTEATIAAASYEVNDLPEAADEIPIGRAVRDAETYVLDSKLQAVPIGITGELHIGGSGLARGYLNGPDLTAEKFIPHPFSREPGARLYKTGDRARYSSDGQLEFLGRLDHQVKLRGFRIEPGEIEAALREHTAVDEVIVLLHEGADDQGRLVAWMQTRAKNGLTASQLRALLQQKLPEYMIPSAIVLLDELPRTPSGKVDRAALPEPDQFQSESFIAPRNPMEELVAEIWSQVLNLPQVGAEDNFFRLGGHSLLATQVISRVREVFSVEVSLRRLFEEPTVRGLSRSIEEALRAGQGVTVTALKRLEAADREQWRGELPLSFAQQRLWFLDQLEQGNVSYNVPLAVRLEGELQVEALERALSEIVRRHEVLRTRFVSVGGEPRQEVLAAADVKLAVRDLRKLAGADQEAELERLLREEAQVPFDLLRGPLLRAVLYQLANDEHVLQVTIHHIVGDGWSIGILIRELSLFYEAAKKGEPAPLPALPIQYADFAIWQREYLRSETLEYHVDYWKRELAGTTPLLLPTDNPRPQVQRFRGSEERFFVPADLTASLKALSQCEGVTLFMMLLAAFQVLLHRYTEQSDITIGADIANRNRIETEGLIGFFVNMMVLRVDVSDDPTFRDLLKRVRRISLDAYAHQDLPLEKLVEVLQPERSLSNNPLFQVVFVLQNQPVPTLEVSELKISPIAVDAGMVQFDLILSITEVGDELEGRFSYDIDLFIPATIKQLARRFQVLLESIVTSPHERLSNLRFLLEDETRGFSHTSFPEAMLSQKDFENLVLEIGNPAQHG